VNASLLVNIDVADLDSARDFYVGAFGWRVGRRLGPAALELLGADVPIYLLAQPAGTQPAPGAAPRSYERHWTPIHLDIVVDDLDTSLERALRAGARRESEVSTQAWGRIVRLSDPFGNGLCLLQFLGRGYDELLADPPA
jgi:predicted enzyme related to lactoylglutathione lyase